MRKLRILPTILSVCLALIMLCFGVYATTTSDTTYGINFKIIYNVPDNFVELNTKVYKSDTYLSKADFVDTVEQIANLNFDNIETNTNLIHLTNLDDTYKQSEDLSNSFNYSKSEYLSFKTVGEDTVYAYFIVVNILNLVQNPIYAVIQDEIADITNTFQYNNALQENILYNEDNRNIVIGIMIDDINTSIEDSSQFSCGINVGKGDIAQSEFMTQKYDATNGYTQAKGVVVLDPNINGGSFLGLSGSAITALYVRDGITAIPSQSLKGCSSVKKVVLGDDLNFIGSSAFSNCTSLINITIPDKVTSIGIGVFSGCTSLINITIPDSVTSIGSSAFSDCTSLINIIIPDSVTSIGSSAFKKCTSLTNIIIPDKVVGIGSSTFSNCSDLISITIPDSVTSIGSSAFSSCTSLTTITIPDSVTSIGSSAFSDCTSLINIIIPDSVTSIGSSAFSKCTSLTTIAIPDSVTSIGSSAFSNCTSLTNMTIPDSVTSIGSRAFSDCTSLTTIAISDNLTTI